MPEDQRLKYIKTLLAEAEEFESKKDYKQALDRYQEVLRINHEHDLAVEKFRQNKDILREIEKNELYTAPIPVQLKKAKEYKAVTHYEDARDLLRNILRLSPGHTEAKNLLKEEVDLVDMRKSGPFLRHQIYTYGKVIYQDGSDFPFLFRADSIRDSLDTEHLRKVRREYMYRSSKLKAERK